MVETFSGTLSESENINWLEIRTWRFCVKTTNHTKSTCKNCKKKFKG